MKRKWTNESAKEYVRKVETGKMPIGMKFLSAKDYLKNHRTISKHSIVGI